MQLFTDRTVSLLMDVCAVTFALCGVSILIALTFDAVEDLLQRLGRALRLRRGERGAVAVEAALLFPIFAMLVMGGLVLHLGVVDLQRLETAAQNAARAGASRLLTADETGNIERHDAEAVTLAEQVYSANAPSGASTPSVVIDGRVVRVSGSKVLDFMGWLPAKSIGATSEAYAAPERRGAI